MRDRYARIVVFLRWLILPAWIGAVVAVSMTLPTLEEQAGALRGIIPEDAPAVAAERAALQEFGFPLETRTAIVQRDPQGFSDREQRQIVEQALQLSRGRFGFESVVGAVPILNTDRALPGAQDGPPTTAVTYLFLRPEATDDALELGRGVSRALARVNPDLPEPLITGVKPAQIAQAEVVEGRLWLLEIATGILVASIVGFHFRSLVAPLVTLAAVAISYLLALRTIAGLAQAAGMQVIEEVRPVIVVLMFGVVTDYTVFFVGRMQQRLRAGSEPKDAARVATRDVAGVVSVAAFAIAAASAALLVADFDFFHSFGPAMAVAVLIAWLVVVTLTPALMAIAGRRLFWPRPPEAVADEREEEPVPERQRKIIGFATRHRFVTAAVSIVLLGAAASGLLRAEIYNPTLLGLPDDTEPARGLEAARAGFPAGVLSPLGVLVRGQTLREDPGGLSRLEQLLQRQPGVASVLAPADVPEGVPPGLLVTRDGDAARLLVVPRAPPLSPAAIELAERLEQQLPELLRRAGLPAAEGAVYGDAAVTAQTIDQTLDDLFWRIGPAVLVVLFIVLALYLRALVAPIYLLVVSVAALLAALGLTVYVFQVLLGEPGLGFFVPVTVFVLLVSLGSDYNIFLVGRIWDEARELPLREAIVCGGGRAASSISAAGVVLAASFALLALVPTTRFQEVAFAMAVGLLIDAFLVRTLLIPALIAMFGRVSGWPGGRLRDPERRPAGRPLAAGVEG